uniref:(northern house mosquito) hypothetical protein n=1 Tax=Culex pipiens TaxID=7175 RepID=A0A8D8GNG7_CULPI
MLRSNISKINKSIAALITKWLNTQLTSNRSNRLNSRLNQTPSTTCCQGEGVSGETGKQRESSVDEVKPPRIALASREDEHHHPPRVTTIDVCGGHVSFASFTLWR